MRARLACASRASACRPTLPPPCAPARPALRPLVAPVPRAPAPPIGRSASRFPKTGADGGRICDQSTMRPGCVNLQG